jgi:dihydrofolate reductase
MGTVQSKGAQRLLDSDTGRDQNRFPRANKMRELIADLFISLDGFASGVNEAAFFGYFGEELGKWINDHLAEPQELIMGRVTYTALANLSSVATDDVSLRMTELPKLVFSSTLREPLAWENTQLVKGSLADEILTLKRKTGEPLRCIGSIRLVGSMIQLGLVDRLRLMIFPLILGTVGKEPIFAAYRRTSLKLIDTRVLDSRLILLEYRLAHSTVSV